MRFENKVAGVRCRSLLSLRMLPLTLTRAVESGQTAVRNFPRRQAGVKRLCMRCPSLFTVAPTEGSLSSPAFTERERASEQSSTPSDSGAGATSSWAPCRWSPMLTLHNGKHPDFAIGTCETYASFHSPPAVLARWLGGLAEEPVSGLACHPQHESAI